ncbi:2-hydroxyacid dehydrogenase [Pararhizobium haloflavum]|uniref:2-hydroxyacid dehydrogenase n=1 Tax=Pararhizobium haloflavum TaxID=2037914 RepID=UPI000C17E87C|nr:2-hydroxyacid dehydrogenase [Pararhizobium haloflavum]
MPETAPRVLMQSRMNERLKARVEAEFPVLYVDRLDAVSDSDASSITAIAGWGDVSSALIDRLTNLKVIANFGVGYDAIDAGHAAQKGVMVTNTPDVLSAEVADVAVGLLLNTVRELPRAETHLREGNWARAGAYPLTGLTLRGRSVGIYGLGRIGMEIAKRLAAFDLPVSYYARHRKDVPYAYEASLEALARAVDTLIVAVPGGAATEKSVDAEVLRALGPQGVLINIGRGTVVDEAALIDALADGTIAAAGLDVFANEPHVPQALIDLPNASLLPHVASASVATRDAMADLAADNLIAWLRKGRALTPVPECAHLNR